MASTSAPCVNCGASDQAEAGYCTACGTALAARLCANGHVMDTEWAECEYCSARPAPPGKEDGAGSRAVESPPAEASSGFGSRAGLLAGADESARGSGGSTAPRRAVLPEPPADPLMPRGPAASRQRTVYDPGLPDESAGTGPAGAPVARARLVGWLVTFALDPAGVDFRLREGRNVIGTDPDCDVVLACVPGISGQHAILMYRNGELKIRDNDSTNGTRVNGRDIFGQGAVSIDDGDLIRLGKVELTLHLL